MTETNQKPLNNPDVKPLIVIASNRGPYSFDRDANGGFTGKRGSGGLVTALAALAEQLDVLWIAAALGENDKAWAQQQNKPFQNVEGIDLRLIITEDKPYQQYYNQIANPLLWFIHHGLWDMVRNPMIDGSAWAAWRDGYVEINRQFAKVIAECVREVKSADPDRPVIVFPQDYHLYMVPKFLRQELGFDVQIQPFIHIPWPGPDGWRILPAEIRNEIITSLMDSDRIGFQTKRDAFNFVQTARFYVEGAHSRGSRESIEYDGRKIGALAYPISIDVDKVKDIVNDPQARLHKGQLIGFIGDRKLILRVDRVEPSKNILRSLVAYRAFLERYPQHHGKVQMLALLVPSRMAVDEYQNYLRDIMAEAGMINANYSDEFWEPVRIIVGNNYPRALAAMQLYDVLLVNPLADGMNLVAKEGALVNDRDGVLLLSEHAGAFYELGDHALIVPPFDVYTTAEAMHQALTMPADERKTRADAMKDIVQRAGVREWFYNQVQDALTASSNQVRNSSTPATPSTKTSADSKTTSGV